MGSFVKPLGTLRPDYVVRGISSITPSDLKDHGVTAVLLDYNNTVVGYGENIKSPERETNGKT